ncbi:cysteine desulfurase family protein [Pontiella agarivorans]|uniref:Cysteine desulfurase family protein n=1 Tax=Pontiella agarivorans TaxID=3038953 RepID=A0ABU5MTD2_9BACT|nr:cysteine desulfurase family protein [Pontiella agarivorans]MDZ8117458.1 cysteine desulfurase family protein [Pontiella agarivorans]
MYFDYAATTPPNDEVLKTFDTVNRDFWANPHALHRPGLRAEQLLEQARGQVLALLGAESGFRCIFTSGATESNNMAIRGTAYRFKKRGKHLITSAVEHPSVLTVFQSLESEGFDVTVLPVLGNGTVDPEELKNALRPDTTLVSLMHVNNEVGAINELPILGKVIKEGSDAVFHVDAAQSAGKLPIDLSKLQVDLLTFSAHKFYGLKGSGALLLPEKMVFKPLLYGGGQEFGLRSGTADPARAAAMAKALRLSLKNWEEDFAWVSKLRFQIQETLQKIPEVEINGSLDEGSPYIINCSVAGIKPETILQGLAEKKIYISTVSACSARQTAESFVVKAVTGDTKRAQHSIRISLASITAQDEVDGLCATLPELIETLR